MHRINCCSCLDNVHITWGLQSWMVFVNNMFCLNNSYVVSDRDAAVAWVCVWAGVVELHDGSQADVWVCPCVCWQEAVLLPDGCQAVVWACPCVCWQEAVQLPDGSQAVVWACRGATARHRSCSTHHQQPAAPAAAWHLEHTSHRRTYKQ